MTISSVLEPAMKFKPRQSSPGLPSFDYRGSYVYHLVFTSRGQQPRFRDGRLVATCLECLGGSAGRYGFDVVAYCFMPDHLHILVAGSTDSQVVRFVQHFKQATSYRHRGLWQRSFYDHVLRTEESVEDVAVYIWGNPVRAGLVDDAAEYPFSGPGEALMAAMGRPAHLEDRAEALSLRLGARP